MDSRCPHADQPRLALCAQGILCRRHRIGRGTSGYPPSAAAQTSLVTLARQRTITFVNSQSKSTNDGQAEYVDPTFIPPREEWASLWSATLPRFPSAEFEMPVGGREQLQSQLIDAANAYTRRLWEVGLDAGVLADAASRVATDRSSNDELTARTANQANESDRNGGQQRIVLTGHQPIVFHGGLVFKYQQTCAFASDVGATAIAIILDTDQGDAGQIQVPLPDPADATACLSSTRSLTRGGPLFLAGKWKDSAEIQAIADDVDAIVRITFAEQRGRLAEKHDDRQPPRGIARD